ncbi:MAG TPA: CYTH domain-containing protein [Patescibacteria group bacterium]|nr:CYTH domain-containing protein [Patescibacteria group bacterium]
MNQYEVEIKSLLGAKENADALIGKLKQDPTFQSFGEHKQLNHYFIGGDIAKAVELIKSHIKDQSVSGELHELVSKIKDYSMRTRWADGRVIFVIKGSVDDTTSSNGTARREFEAETDSTLEELDKMILDAGFKYQSKWSRQRQEFKYKGLNVTVDKNAGYGYLSEFEKIIEDPSLAEQTKDEIRAVMAEIGVAELVQDRLARMFDFYNAHWDEYYGTEKVFNIE